MFMTLDLDILYREIPWAKMYICFLKSLVLNKLAKKKLLNVIMGLKPKQKLFKYTFCLLSNQTVDIPTSYGISEEVVNITSPYRSCFCLGSISIFSVKDKSEIRFLKTFKYVTYSASP